MGKVHQHHIRAGGRPANVTPIVTHGSAGFQLAPGVSLPEQVTVALQEVALDARAGLLAFAVGVGLEVFHTLLEENVSELVGQKGQHQLERQAYRHGHEPSSLTLGGRKVLVDKPRVRSCQGQELPVPLWKAFSDQDIAGTMVLERMLAGVSTRQYPVSLEPVGELHSRGTSPAAVSRQFVARTHRALSELLAKDLTELQLCVLMLDGIQMAGHTIVIALGIDRQGYKHVLGLREGSTENKALCTGVLTGLVERGVDASAGLLVVIDGGKGLRAAVKDVFGDQVLVQRCRLHKRRNVLEHLPEEQRERVGRQLDRAWAKPEYSAALTALKDITKQLDEHYPGAAGSLHEGLEETLTITQLHIPLSLTKTLFSTNPIESMNSISRTAMRNVKHWRSGTMVCRWTAAALEVATVKFRRVKGYRELPLLVAALAARTQRSTEHTARIA